MCTDLPKPKIFTFGRNLDYEFSYGEQLVVTPRNYPFRFRQAGELNRHYAILGMAHVAEGYPLYYDAINEAGLCVAGLNFVGNAVYHPAADGKENIAQFELIPWLLGRCASLAEARELLAGANLLNLPFSPQYPLAALHWMIADRTGCITLESTADGLHVYDNPAGVLTNNPPFPLQMFNLNNYREPQPSPTRKSVCAGAAPCPPTAAAWAGFGLSGRSVLPVPLCAGRICAGTTPIRRRMKPAASASCSTFSALSSSKRAAVRLTPGKYEYTIYTSCCNADKGDFIITPPTISIRSPQWICTGKTWTETPWCASHEHRAGRFLAERRQTVSRVSPNHSHAPPGQAAAGTGADHPHGRRCRTRRKRDRKTKAA